jgi:hypothetical protein
MSSYSEISEYGDSEKGDPEGRLAGSRLSVSPYPLQPRSVDVGDTVQLMRNQRGCTPCVSLI